jgi:hypothetical protein
VGLLDQLEFQRIILLLQEEHRLALTLLVVAALAVCERVVFRFQQELLIRLQWARAGLVLAIA